MALNVGDLVAYLDLDDKGFDRGLNGAQGKFGKFAGFLGKAAVAGVAAAGVAVAGFAAYGVKQFAQFEQGMNEVFTLLPGISEQAMGAMMDDTRAFVREMGVAHDQAVPALYQALSAGVPQANVFDFMKVAAKAAKGGVTDLETAVDGISGVINSYGAETINATQASDLMFTAVKLGKTTFGELSGSLYNVLPTASALGVGFGDITAAMSAMTAQNIPTSVATTQLRQAFVEMSKAGGATATTFEKVAGKSFKDFIAGGGNVQQALQLLEQHAEHTGVGINDLFGSVEAGAAALALTGGGTDKFTSALAGMADSAGATDAAYEKMDRGLARSMERIKIAFTDAAIGVGQSLAPALAEVADWLANALPGAAAAIPQILGRVTSFFSVFGADVSALVRTVGGAWESFQAGMAGKLSGFDAVTIALNEVGLLFGRLRESWQYLQAGLAGRISGFDNLSTSLNQVGLAVSGFRDNVMGVVRAVVPAFLSLAGSVAGFVRALLPTLLGFGRQIMGVLGPALTSIGDLISTQLVPAFQRFLPAVQPIATFLLKVFGSAVVGALKGVVNVVQGVVKAISGILNVFTAVLTGDWSAAWGALKQIASGAFQAIVGAVQVFLNVGILRLFRAGFALLRTIATAGLSAVRSLFTGNLAAVQRLVDSAMRAVVGFFRGQLAAVTGVVRSAFTTVLNTVKAAMIATRTQVGAVLAAIRALFTSALTAVRTVVSSAWSAIVGVFRNSLAAARSVVTSGLAGIRSLVTSGLGALRGIASAALSAMAAAVRAGVAATVAVVRGIAGQVRGATSGFAGALRSAGGDLIRGLISGITGKVGDAVRAVKDAVGSVVSGAKSALGIASPSKVFAEIGQQTGLGLIVGLDKMGPSISRSFADAVQLPAVPTVTLPRGAVRGADSPGVAAAGSDLEAVVDELQVLGDRVEKALRRQSRDAEWRERTTVDL